MARKAADGLTITSVNFSIRASVARRWLGDDAPAPVASDAPNAAAPAAPEAPPAAAPAAPAAPMAAAPAAPAPQPRIAVPPSKPKMLTPAKPYRIDDVVAAQIKEMEDMGDEMDREIKARMGRTDR